MRAASNKSHQPETDPCPECRKGWVYAAPWEAWLSRRDDAEAKWLAEHGTLAGFATPSELLEELPDIDEDVECPSCSGAGTSGRLRSRRNGHQREADAA